MSTQTEPEAILHMVLSALLLCGVTLVFLGIEGIGAVLFWLSFILAIVIFVGYLFNWVILRIHGPGWVHPVEYLKQSRELRTVLIGAGCATLVWWHYH